MADAGQVCMNGAYIFFSFFGFVLGVAFRSLGRIPEDTQLQDNQIQTLQQRIAVLEQEKKEVKI